jgi:transposase
MFIVESIAKIRRMYYVEKKSIRSITNELGISRNTVRKILRTDATKFEMAEYNRTTVTLGGYLPKLIAALEENAKEPVRRRLTAKKLHKLLCEQGFTGSYESVNLEVRKYRREHEAKGLQVFVPLSFDPGESFQFDWGLEEVEIAGRVIQVKAARIKLCHSRHSLVVVYPNEQLEMVIDAHNEAFKFFDGCCKNGIFDNMKTAIKKILDGKDRELNERFAQMASYHLFKPIACTPASGWEKGQVEKQVGDTRRNFFTPLLKGDDYSDINNQLKSMCVEWSKTMKHPEFSNKTVWDVYQEEKSYLIPYRGECTSYRLYATVVSSMSTVMYDTNVYSVECAYVGRHVQIKPLAWQIIILHYGKIIGQHLRSFERNAKIYNPWHYVPALERKPGALRNGAPFKELMDTLPLVFRQVQSRLCHHKDGDKQFIKILLLVMKYGLDTVGQACLEAIATGGCSVDLVESYLLKSVSNATVETAGINGSEVNSKYIQLKTPPDADCSIYNRIYLSEGGIA